MKYKLLLVYVALLITTTIDAQVKRTFRFGERSISYLAQNNRITNDFSFPGMSVFIIVGSPSQSLQEIYDADELHTYPISGMEAYSCFYYLSSEYFEKDSSFISFLSEFIKANYEQDFFNRNKVYLVWNDTTNILSCDDMNESRSFLAAIVLPTTNQLSCDSVVILRDASDLLSPNRYKTAVQYVVPGLNEMETIIAERKRIEMRTGLDDFKKKFFIQLTRGNYSIGEKQRTPFDTVTLVDFSKLKALWNVRTGYYITQSIGVIGEVGFMYTGKIKNIDSIEWGGGNGIRIKGSGSAGAMVKYGLGIRYIPYAQKRLSTWLDVTAGKGKLIAGGGRAIRSIGGGGSNTTTISKKKENSFYQSITVGASYFISPLFFVSGNYLYNRMPLKDPLGSVKAHTGHSFNLGIGLSFSKQK